MKKMKKTGVFVIALLIMAGSQLPAQDQGTTNNTDPATWSGLDQVFEKQERSLDKKPIPYPPVREATCAKRSTNHFSTRPNPSENK